MKMPSSEDTAPRSIELRGVGWRTGRSATIRFTRVEGPLVVTWRVARFSPFSAPYVAGERTSDVLLGEDRLMGAEHLYAAFAGLSIRNGIAISVEGDEVPLLDGCARGYSDALFALVPETRTAAPTPSHRVTRADEIVVEGSRYAFEPSEHARIEVELTGFPSVVAKEASWDGTAVTFYERIAPSRTFALERELDELFAQGVRPHVDREAVCIVGEKVLHGSPVPDSDEPARHKLLDLVGDMFPFGGPPLGKVRATRPGHARNIEAMKRALAEGVVEALQ